MPKIKVVLTVRTERRVVIEVEAANGSDAEDMATDLFYQDDGCHGIRKHMEPVSNLLDIAICETDDAPALTFTAASVF